jgi:LPS-assembly lipoprotein
MRDRVLKPLGVLDPGCRACGLLAIGLILGTLLSASACGFKLRGQVEIPPELGPIYIQSSPRSPVRDSIVQQIQGLQVRLTKGPREAHVIVRILKESRTSRVVAVDKNGKALASELYYGVTFDAVTPDGKQLVPKQTIDVVRTYENPDIQVLGEQSEAQLIYAEMSDDAANQILKRLRAMLS